MREDVGKMRHGRRKGLSHKEAAPSSYYFSPQNLFANSEITS